MSRSKEHDQLVKMGVFIILLSLLAFTRGDTTMLTVVEGNYTQLNFSYPCNSTRVTLQIASGSPFYDSANPEPLSLHKNREVALQNETEDNIICLLQLNTNPVLRSDDGGYILTAYDGDGDILHDLRVTLRVDYRPGKASCLWGEEENVVVDWRAMQCKVPAENLSWQIACYQNGIRLPQVNTSMVDGDILQQTFWVRYSQNVFCCASLQDQLIDRCACDDIVWPDPLHSGNITDPCPAPHQDSTSTQSSSEDNVYSPTITTLSPVKETVTERPVTFVLLGLIIVVLLVLLLAACRKIRRMSRQRSDYTSVQYVEAQL